jgi:hypothetical protein
MCKMIKRTAYAYKIYERLLLGDSLEYVYEDNIKTDGGRLWTSFIWFRTP